MKKGNNKIDFIRLNAQENLKSFSKTVSRRDARVLAFHLIYAVDRFDYSLTLEEVVENFRKGFGVEVPSDSYAIKIATGVINSRGKLDEMIKPLLKNWKLERLGCCTLLILRMALWELMQPDSVPSIVINEAIELAKAFAEKDAYRFINGILDEACRMYDFRDEEKILEENIEIKE